MRDFQEFNNKCKGSIAVALIKNINKSSEELVLRQKDTSFT